MAIVQAFINGQTIKVNTPAVIVSDTIKYITVDFSFNGASWEGLSKWANFSVNGEALEPIEILGDHINTDTLNFRDGVWTLWVLGTNGDKRITTESAEFTIKKSGMIGEEPFPSITPTVAEQLVADTVKRVQEVEVYKNEVKADADRAELYRNEAGQSETQAEEYAKQANKSYTGAYEAEKRAKDVVKDLPNTVHTYIEDHKAELKGEPGKDGQPGRDGLPGKDAPPYDDTEIRGEVKEISDALVKKADKSELTNLATKSEVNAKADQSEVDGLKTSKQDADVAIAVGKNVVSTGIAGLYRVDPSKSGNYFVLISSLGVTAKQIAPNGDYDESHLGYASNSHTYKSGDVVRAIFNYGASLRAFRKNGNTTEVDIQLSIDDLSKLKDIANGEYITTITRTEYEALADKSGIYFVVED